MRNKNNKYLFAFLPLVFALFFPTFAKAQSTEQNFPTPITEKIISGKIAARDIGDSRLTTYFYTFNGEQGDIILNIQTINFNGDIDVYEAETLRPLNKIRIFADFSADEISRTIYLRKSDKLLLRIEGRSPNDDAATFKIRFDGSFLPSNEEAIDESLTPKVTKKVETETEVNSVGTIISVKPKATPTPKVEVAKVEKLKIKTPKIKIPNIEVPRDVNPKVKKPKVVSEPKVNKPVKLKKVEKEKIAIKNLPEVATIEKRLIVLFADGTKYEKSMKDILKFSIERETLTIITKSGSISRYLISDVLKISIE